MIKKLLFSMLLLAFGFSAMAQQSIQLRSASKAECVKSDMTSLKASFSFSSINAQDYQSERGTFSMLSLPNTVIGGNEGAPQIPVVNELIAVPFGATPRIEITSYTTTDYRLSDYGIHTLVPRQPDVLKNEVRPFVYDEAAYQMRGFRSEPMARVSVNGTMRGVQVGQMTIEPVSYDPVNNTLRVFNNIEVTVHFDGADVRATEDMLVKTYSPYFDVLYKQLFNGRAVRDVYDEHPDLWKSPVRMLVIANRMFENCIQDWVEWKTIKGIYVDVNYTDVIGTSADAIKSFIQTKYAENAPTFLMIMGDEDQVPPSITSASETSEVSDLYYSSVDGDQFVDMFHSRMSAETTAQMTAMLNKSLEYEQYTMPDPSYLNNVLLIAGHDDSGWGVTVGRPTIWYATNYYYNAEHGFDNVYEYTTDNYTNCYAPLNSGVGFANYTAHGAKTAWADPEFSVDDVANMTNEHKYFFAIGNCCITGDWGYSTPCFGEALTRAENKGAFAYIGSCPNTVWLNDYYFGVGPTSRADGTMPTYEETGTGIYDAIWMDDVYNTVNSILYVGNLAGNAAQALGYDMHRDPLYYWQAYHVLGDGSVMPYRVQPTANQVSHMAILPIGMSTYEVSAVPGSYVAISKDGVLHGTGLVGETGTAQVEITPVTSGGDVTICVTAPNRIPYIQTVPAAALEGAYLAVDSYTPTETHVGDNTNLSITFKNVGTDASTGTTNITLTTDDSNVTLNHNTGSFGALAADATTTVSGFSFSINPGVADGTNVTIHYTAVNGEDTYEGNIVIKANEAVLAYQNMSWNGGFTPGETLTLSAKFKNTGHYQATNAVVRMTTTASNYVTINTQPISAGTIEVGQEVTYDFSVTIASNCPETEVLPVTFTMTADGGLTASGTENLKNSCMLYFDLADSYGDGWNGSSLTVSFDDGSESQTLTIPSGNSSASYEVEVGNGTHVTLTWYSGSQWDSECSFTVSYEGNLVIYQVAQGSTPSAGVLYEFDCNCAAATQTYNVTVASDNTEHGTVSGGGEFNYGESCTVIATPAEGYMFTNWTQNGEIVAGAGATYTFAVTSDMDLVAHFAEGLLIGDGSTDTHQYLPSYNYYTNSFSEQIYTSDELGAAGIITGIAFFNGGAEKTLDYDFYMKATTKDSFTSKTDWIAVSESDKVFSGSVTVVANDWTTITFSTPFVYDGTSNVVLVTDKKTQWSNSPHMSCRVFSTSSSQAIYAYDDNFDFNPMSPSSANVSNNDVLQVKNQIIVTKTGFDGCVNSAPTSVEVGNITNSVATVTWTGFSESYYVSLGIANVTTLANEDFSNSIPANWTNDATYPWTIIDGHIQSGNVGEHGTTSSVSITVTFPADGTVEFDAECMGEGSSTYYDHCDFSIDGTRELYAGANLSGSGWLHYIYDVTAGEHTFTWSYTKDSSVNPTGDYFAVDNVLMKAGEITWNAPVAVEDTEYTFGGLTPETGYCVRVQGVCDGVESAWSEAVLFITEEGSVFTKDIEGHQGRDGYYYLIATPINDINPTQVVDNSSNCMIAPVAEDYDLYYFDQTRESEWINYKNGEDGGYNLVSGKGYLYANKNDITLTVTGTPNTNGNVPLVYDGSSSWKGWNLVGNPLGVKAYIDRPFYRMNAGGYEINSESETGSIGVMEGVFVIAEDGEETLTFTAEPQNKRASLALNLSQGHGIVDRAIVRFDEGRTLPKFQINKNSTKLYIPMDNVDYAVVRSEGMGEMPVSFKAGKNGNYTLSFNSEEVSFAYLHLIDNMTGADIDLLANPSYSFDAKTTDYASRFKLVFVCGDANGDNDAFAFYSNGNWVINNEGNATLQVIDVTGRILESESINGCANVNVDAAPGVYMLRLINGENVKVQKVVVK